LQELDCVEAAVTALHGTVKAEIVEPVTILCRSCGKSRTRESNARNIQNQEPKMASNVLSISKVLPVATNINFESVKVEFVTSGSAAAHRDESRLDGNSSKCIYPANAELESFFSCDRSSVVWIAIMLKSTSEGWFNL